MNVGREVHLVGLHYLGAVTELLQRNRRTHPTAGLYEAADLQWWWRSPRSTDDVPQLFWFDSDDRPVAAVVLTDWGDGVTLDPIVPPGATSDRVEHVVRRGIAHATACGFERVELEVARDDRLMIDLLADLHFLAHGDGVTEAWLVADDRPPMSALSESYRLTTRADLARRPHHMIGRSGHTVEQRLTETSLYRPDLDLVVLDGEDQIAGYGLFWFDPTTATGLVEPMRTEDGHQRKGLARHVLTAGLERLAALGAERIKICFEPGNIAARQLYLDVGFVPARETVRLAGPTET